MKRKNGTRSSNAARRVATREYEHKFDQAALDKLRSMGVKMKPVELPDFPYGGMRALLQAEAAAAFRRTYALRPR